MKLVKIKKRNFESTLKGIIYLIEKIFSKKENLRFIPELGLSFYVKSSTIFSRHLYKYGAWEAEQTNWVISNFKDLSSPTFVDVGANFGWYTCLFSKLAKNCGEVISIEPSPDNLYFLEKNISLNELNNISLKKMAVGKSKTKLDLYLAKSDNPGAHSLIKDTPLQNPENKKFSVDVQTLDFILGEVTKINLMKMDIEGFEIIALKGGLNILDKVENILIEFSPHLWKNPSLEASEFFKLLSDKGLMPYILEKTTLKKFSHHDVQELIEDLKKPDIKERSISLNQRDFIFSRS